MDDCIVNKNVKHNINVKMECIIPQDASAENGICQNLSNGMEPQTSMKNSECAKCATNEIAIAGSSQHPCRNCSNFSNGLVSINAGSQDLNSPLIDDDQSGITHTVEEAKLQGIVFLEDAIYYRSIHHKANLFSLKLYRWYHSELVKCAVNVATFILLMLAFFEDPSSLSWSSDPRRNNVRFLFPFGFTEGIELVSLVILAFSGIAQGYMSTNGNKTKLSFMKRNPWLTGGYVVLILSFVDFIVSLVLGNHVYRIRIRRLFRPYFLAQNTTMLKKTLKAMWNTVPELVSVFTLLALHLYFFTMLGMLVFHKRDVNGTASSDHDDVFNNTEWTLYFKSVDTALISLVVLLTTANNPDVMMPSYSENRLYAIYFIVFSLAGTFLIFNLLTAIIYNQFRGYFKCSMQTSYFRRCVALSAAHRALSTLNHQVTACCHRVSLSTVREVVAESRMSHDQRIIVVRAISNVEKQNEIDLDLEGFSRLFNNIDSRCEHVSPRRSMPVWTSKTMKLIQKVVLSRYFNWAGNLIALLNAVLMTIEIAIHYDQAFQGAFSRLNIMNYIFVGYYSIEQILKVLSLGKRYFVDLNCLYDGIITVALVCLEVVQLAEFSNSSQLTSGYGLTLWDSARLVNILVLIRLLRIIPNIKPMALVTGVMLEIIRSLKSFAGIIIIIYYIFAIMGMMAFEGAINPPANSSTIVYQCGTYEQLQYWANNFDDFASSLVVLWDVMVVNNWGVFLHAFKKDVSPWSQIYFVAWWLISSVVCINLFVALILDHFIAKWERSSDEGNLPSRGTIQSLFHKHLREPSRDRIEEELRKHPFLSEVHED